MSDPYAERRDMESFLDTLMRGYTDAGWAMLEMKQVALLRPSPDAEHRSLQRVARLKRVATKLRDASLHIEAAIARGARLP